MSLRREHSLLLKQAVASMDVINSDSPNPEICINNAINDSSKVWNEANYLDGTIRKQLRINIVSLNGLKQAAQRKNFLDNEDLATVANVKTRIAQIAEILATTPSAPRRTAHSNYSPLGMRFDELSQLGDAKPFVVAPYNLHVDTVFPNNDELSKVESRLETAAPYSVDDATAYKKIEELQSQKSKLPSKINNSQGYITARMPIIATLKHLDSNKLRRSGLDYVVVPGGFLFKNPAVMGNPSLRDMPTVVFKNQLVLGVTNDIVNQHRDDVRKIELQLKKKSDGKAYKDIKQLPTLKSIIEKVSERWGHHVDVLSTTNKVSYMRSPGNPLAWVWLMPDSVLSQGFMKVAQANFPWMGKEDESVKRANLEKDARDLKTLQEQQQVLLKRGMSLKSEDLTKISQLLQRQNEFKPSEKPEDKTKRLASMKKELQDRLDKKFAREYIQIKLLKEEIESFADSSDKSAKTKMRSLKKEIEEIEAKIERAKPTLIADIRAKYK